MLHTNSGHSVCNFASCRHPKMPLRRFTIGRHWCSSSRTAHVLRMGMAGAVPAPRHSNLRAAAANSPHNSSSGMARCPALTTTPSVLLHCFKSLKIHFCELEVFGLIPEYFLAIGGKFISGYRAVTILLFDLIFFIGYIPLRFRLSFTVY